MTSRILPLLAFLLLPGLLLPQGLSAQAGWLDLSDHYPEVMSDVVRIQSKPGGETLGSGFFFQRQGAGEGTIEEAWVLSNAHVVAGQETVHLEGPSGQQWDARVLDRDESLDLALLVVHGAKRPGGLVFREPVPKIGEPVWAVGSPFGLEASLSSGHLSAQGRYFTAEPTIPYLQMDMSLNPGGSGGPLLDMQGQVMGINTQVVGREEGQTGLAFAIPAWVVIRYLSVLRDNGGERGYLGLQLASGTGPLIVSRVVPDSPAERAGIEPRDRLSAPEAVTAPTGYLRHRLLKPLAGEAITVLRETPAGETQLRVLEAESHSRANRHIPWLGIQARRHGDGGVEVVEVEHSDSRLEVGDRLLRQGSRSVEHPFDLSRQEAASTIPLLVERQGQRFFLPVKVMENER